MSADEIDIDAATTDKDDNIINYYVIYWDKLFSQADSFRTRFGRRLKMFRFYCTLYINGKP